MVKVEVTRASNRSLERRPQAATRRLTSSVVPRCPGTRPPRRGPISAWAPRAITIRRPEPLAHISALGREHS
jgi:hypothetical protein